MSITSGHCEEFLFAGGRAKPLLSRKRRFGRKPQMRLDGSLALPSLQGL